MIYRKMKASDINLIRNFERKCREFEPDTFTSFDESIFLENFQKYNIEEYNNNETILCIEDGVVIGRLDALVELSFASFKTVGYIDWVSVLKPFRNKGIAKQLFKEAEDFFRKKNCVLYYLIVDDTTIARGFYNSIDVKIEFIDRASKQLV